MFFHDCLPLQSSQKLIEAQTGGNIRLFGSYPRASIIIAFVYIKFHHLCKIWKLVAYRLRIGAKKAQPLICKLLKLLESDIIFYSAKPLFTGSNPVAASKEFNGLAKDGWPFLFSGRTASGCGPVLTTQPFARIPNLSRNQSDASPELSSLNPWFNISPDTQSWNFPLFLGWT